MSSLEKNFLNFNYALDFEYETMINIINYAIFVSRNKYLKIIIFLYIY